MLNRAEWTPERQRLLREMWDRGDSVEAIAAAVGTSVAAIYVARHRFELPARGRSSGRPQPKVRVKVKDEPGHTIERVSFTTSRLMEFCRKDELERQTGHPADDWVLVVFKELIDNALDACEEAEVPPIIKVAVMAKDGAKIVIKDNGPGMPASTIKGITDYSVRTSSREAYTSPTRGAQGNALKTILAMAFVLSGERGETWIEARGIRHRIRFEVDQLRQEPMVTVAELRSQVVVGTTVTVSWPELDDFKYRERKMKELLVAYAWCNPHLDLTVDWNGTTIIECEATNPTWRKWRPRDATSAHWYDLQSFMRYAVAHISSKRKQGRGKFTVRDYISEFRGMRSTEKQREVLKQFPGAAHRPLAQFAGNSKHINDERMERLLSALQDATFKVRPELLGVIGKEHLAHMMELEGADLRSFQYQKMLSDKDAARPYVIEVAFAVHKSAIGDRVSELRVSRRLIQAVNFSAAVGDNIYVGLAGGEGVSEILVHLRMSSNEPVIVFVHMVAPRVRYLDRGKSRVALEND
jgi:DNA topoisomerase VI subunit B